MKTITSLLVVAALSLFTAAGCASQPEDVEQTGETRSAMVNLPVGGEPNCHFLEDGCPDDWTPGGGGGPSQPSDPPETGGDPGQVEPPLRPSVNRCVLTCNRRYPKGPTRTACVEACADL